MLLLLLMLFSVCAINGGAVSVDALVAIVFAIIVRAAGITGFF